MEKPTTLMGDLPTIRCLQRTLTRVLRNKFKKTRKQLRKKLGLKKPYIVSKSGKVHGTKELSDSAVYTNKFCNSVIAAWFETYSKIQSEICDDPEIIDVIEIIDLTG